MKEQAMIFDSNFFLFDQTVLQLDVCFYYVFNILIETKFDFKIIHRHFFTLCEYVFSAGIELKNAS